MMSKILLALLMLATFAVSAQNVTLKSDSEVMDSSKFSRLVKSYEQVIMADREELTLIKVDLLGPMLFGLSGVDSSKHNVARVTFERKFKPELSWLLAVEAQANKYTVTELRYRGGARYYFNMEKRILKGKSANNFSANYISSRFNYKRRRGGANQFSFDLLFGIQRRLWKYGFVDFDVGIENIISPFPDKSAGVDFTSSIQIGIAF